MAAKRSFHSVCRWSFNPGKGGFLPSNVRPSWAWDKLDTVSLIEYIAKQISPRLPEHIQLGFEVHYDTEVNDRNAAALADAMAAHRIYLAFMTPGAHSHCAYGGVCSLDPQERSMAEDLSIRSADLTYGALRKSWLADCVPSLILWNGSWGYDLASVGIADMYHNLKESVAKLCKHEQKLGGQLYLGIEPKPNEGHPAMLMPTVASTIAFWHKLCVEYGLPIAKKGVNKEFGHSEMIGLDPVYDTVEECDHNMLVHMHVNSQGGSDGIVLGGPGKFDIDHGARINGVNIAIAGVIRRAGYRRWKGHDMQPRGYDNERQALDRIVRSILSWEACELAAAQLDEAGLLARLAKRDTAGAEDLIADSVATARKQFAAWMK